MVARGDTARKYSRGASSSQPLLRGVERGAIIAADRRPRVRRGRPNPLSVSGLPHRLVLTLLVLVAAYGAISLVAYLYGERVLFQPPAPSYGPDDVPFTRVPVDEGSAAGGGDSVAVQHLPNPAAEFTILFSHGNAEDLGHDQPFLRALRDAGFAVLAYDYRGYGRSTDRLPTEKRAVEDAEAVYRYAVRELGIRPDRLIVHGRSLGAGPTLALATRHEVAAVVLESAFTSTYRVVTRAPLLPFDRFPNLVRVRSLDVPVLVIHGTRDRVIPASHGRALFAAAAEPKRALWVEGAGHNDVAWSAGPRYVAALVELSRLARH